MPSYPTVGLKHAASADLAWLNDSRLRLRRRVRAKCSTMVVGILWLVLTACAGPSGPRRIEPTGTYAHVVSQLEFPERLGVFRRQFVTEYDEGGFDVSGHYESPRSLLVTATVYHYPANATATRPTRDEFVDHFRRVVGEVGEATPGGRIVTTETVEVEMNTFALTGLHSAYAYDSFRGYNAEVRSHVYLFVLDGWYLKFRFTNPADIDETATVREIEMMESITWPIERPPDSDGSASGDDV